jgi:preprotein translocase subunit Sec63
LSLYLKIVLILFGLVYFISPVDIIPDLLLPFIGWIDDSVIIGIIIYLIRYGKLPNFFFKKKGVAKPKNSAQQQTKTPYEILGIRPNSSKKQIQSAYKEAIKKYHPDKLSHLGEEFSDLANAKFLAVQKAYDILMGK